MTLTREPDQAGDAAGLIVRDVPRRASKVLTRRLPMKPVAPVTK